MTAGKLLRSYNPVPSPTTSGSPSSIASISFNPAEFMMSATNTQGRVQFYDLQTFEGISTCDTSGVGQLKVTEFDPDGTCLLSIGTEGMEVIRIFIFEKYFSVLMFRRHRCGATNRQHYSTMFLPIGAMSWTLNCYLMKER